MGTVAATIVATIVAAIVVCFGMVTGGIIFLYVYVTRVSVLYTLFWFTVPIDDSSSYRSYSKKKLQSSVVIISGDHRWVS